MEAVNIVVYLADLANGIEYPARVRSRLQDYFDKVAAKNGKATVEVRYSSKAPNVSPRDMLVYFVSSPSDSVVKGLGGSPTSGTTGLTHWKGDVFASEVYIEKATEKSMANTAFHELMHNKCRLGDHGLHTYKGVSMGKGTISEDTPLVAADIALMANKLLRERKQWTGGFAYYNDPLRLM